MHQVVGPLKTSCWQLGFDQRFVLTADQVVGDGASWCSLALGFVEQNAAVAIDDRVVHHDDVIDSLISTVRSTRRSASAEDREGGVPSRASKILKVVVDDRVVAVDDSNAARVACTVAKKEVSFDSGVVTMTKHNSPVALAKGVSLDRVVT